MYNDEDYNDEFQENEQDEITTIMQSNEIKGTYYDVVDQLVRANFKNIEVRGINIEQMRLNNLNISELQRTLDFMLKWFLETEEYEKCKVIQDYLTDLKEA
jgi:protein involved in sex pheromone biosynthesis